MREIKGKSEQEWFEDYVIEAVKPALKDNPKPEISRLGKLEVLYRRVNTLQRSNVRDRHGRLI